MNLVINDNRERVLEGRKLNNTWIKTSNFIHTKNMFCRIEKL